MGNSSASNQKYFISGSAIALLGKVSLAALTLVSNALLVRLLGPEDVGTYFLIVSLVTSAAIVGRMGLNQTSVKLIARAIGNEQQNQIKSIVKRVIVFGASGALVSIAVLNFWFSWKYSDPFELQASSAYAYISVSMWVFLLVLQAILLEVVRGFRRVLQMVLLNKFLEKAFVTAILVVVWVSIGTYSLSHAVLLSTIAIFLNVTIIGTYVWSITRDLPNDGTVSSKEILTTSWPIFITSLLFFVLPQCYIWILYSSQSSQEVAIYGAVLRFVGILMIPLSILNTLAPPFIAELYANGQHRKLEHILQLSATAIGVPSVMFLCLFIAFGPFVLELVFGEFYREGATALTILALGQIVSIAGGSCGNLLTMTGHERASMVISFGSSILSLMLAMFLVHPFGVTGIAVAYSTNVIIQNVCLAAYGTLCLGVRSYMNPFLLGEVIQLARTYPISAFRTSNNGL